jgi:hypothetical protein
MRAIVLCCNRFIAFANRFFRRSKEKKEGEKG